MSTLVQFLHVEQHRSLKKLETKTRDNVFVRTKVSVQYQIIRDKVHDSYYRLSDPIAQIESYIFDVVRSEIPKLTLDEVFVNKDTVAKALAPGQNCGDFIRDLVIKFIEFVFNCSNYSRL